MCNHNILNNLQKLNVEKMTHIAQFLLKLVTIFINLIEYAASFYRSWGSVERPIKN
jgi:hypothetical protein